MTAEEARAVLQIMCHADGGCHVCGSELTTEFAVGYPQFTDLARDVFVAYHSWEADDVFSAEECARNDIWNSEYFDEKLKEQRRRHKERYEARDVLD